MKNKATWSSLIVAKKNTYTGYILKWWGVIKSKMWKNVGKIQIFLYNTWRLPLLQYWVKIQMLPGSTQAPTNVLMFGCVRSFIWKQTMKQIMLHMQSKGSYINTERLADSDIIIIIIISMNIVYSLVSIYNWLPITRTLTNWNHANSNQNRFPLDFHDTTTT